MIKLPNYLKELQPLPEDLSNQKTYGYQNQNFNAFVKVFPVLNMKSLMPADFVELVGGIHSALSDDQGLIEVNIISSSKTGLPIVYSIIKTYLGTKYGVQYFLKLQLLANNKVYEINAFFGEEGITGVREATIMAKYNKMPADWMQDPYDKEFKKGIRMNESEKIIYDFIFPYHPLTKCRELIEFIRDNN